ncbi:methionyl-tRNA formyltransferase [candidate division WWE3 bacterium]|uniref:methionyl-tRNA formyltransferase n=1 Tax=candidate division WWE3 bacterium TaxID=2053526 RepID=A0A955LK29_UNCKA|nr:methionyl-tRNA formyltransferase [candidate division WWE3 bacterium]
MKIIFFGSDYYSTIAFDLLLKSETIEVVQVVTGRKKATYPFEYNSVSEIAQTHGIPTLNISSSAELKGLKDDISLSSPDFGFIYSFGYLVPPEIFNIPKHKTLNLHPSFLPKYRGVSPMQQAILNGDTKTGVTLITVDEDFDTGGIVFQAESDINANDTTYSLAHRLVTLGVDKLIDLLKEHPDGDLPTRSQPNKEASYTTRFTTEDAYLNLVESEETNYRKIRAFYPKPIAWTYLSDLVVKLAPDREIPTKWEGQRVKVFSAEYENGRLTPTNIQIEGKSPMTFADFARGYLK